MVQNDNYVLGHAIFKGRDTFGDLAKKILKEGFKIEDVSRGIKFTARSFEPIYEECLENLRDLSINSSGSVIIISIPKYLLSNYDSRLFDSCDSSSVLLELTGETSNIYKDIFGNPTKVALLPSMYVLGYFDVQQDIFVENQNYAFRNNNINIYNLKLTLDKRYEEILKESKLDHTKKL